MFVSRGTEDPKLVRRRTLCVHILCVCTPMLVPYVLILLEMTHVWRVFVVTVCVCDCVYVCVHVCMCVCVCVCV